MSISYSLVIRETPALLAVDSEGYLVDDPNAQWLAGAKGFVPRTWWSLFEFAEPRGPQLHGGLGSETTIGGRGVAGAPCCRCEHSGMAT